jgi:hypothetical protein
MAGDDGVIAEAHKASVTIAISHAESKYFSKLGHKLLSEVADCMSFTEEGG